MAWLSFVLVTIVFYAPGLNLAERLLQRNLTISFELPLFTVTVPIPFTGFLRLLISLGVSWSILWWALTKLWETIEKDEHLATQKGGQWIRKLLDSWVQGEYPWMATEHLVTLLAKIIVGVGILKALVWLILEWLLSALGLSLLPFQVQEAFREVLGTGLDLVNKYVLGHILSYIILALFFLLVVHPLWERERLERWCCNMSNEAQ